MPRWSRSSIARSSSAARASSCTAAGDANDLADVEEAEIVILREFLPEPLTDAEVEQLVRGAIASTGASSPSDMGKVMGALVPQTKGRADGKLVSDLVRRLLSEGSPG